MTDHDVVLYGNDSAALTQCVVPFIASAVQDGGAALIVAASQHERAFRSALAAVGVDAGSGAMSERLIFLNASQTLNAISVNGTIEPSRFSRVVGNLVRRLRKRFTVHVYGEMVGLLRASGKPGLAVQLERLWQELLGEVSFRLVCGYPLDVLGEEFHPAEIDTILTSHTRLLSVLPGFESALNVGIASTLGDERVTAIRGMIQAKRRLGAALPEPEATLLWLREHLPNDAAAIIERARARYEDQRAVS